MGRNLVAPNKTEGGVTGAQEVQRKEAEALSMPSRGSVAQRVMSMGGAEKGSAASQGADNRNNSAQPSALYRVRAGDNPSVIAHRFKVPLEEIYKANPELEPTKMSIGQGIRIPGIQQNFHIIQKGESLSSVAAAHKIALKDLLEANPQVEPKRLQIGQAVYLPLLERQDGRVIERPREAVHPTSQPTIRVAAQPAVTAPPKTDPAPRRGSADHSAEWKPIEVDPRLLNSRYVTPLSTDPSSNFYVSVLRSLRQEGGLSTNPNDLAHQGGVKVTNYGITGMAMTEYLTNTGRVSEKPSDQVLTEKIKALTYGEALDIYASNFWHKGYQSIDKKVAFLLFDWGIIGGKTTTLQIVQDSLGVKKTGKMDSETVAAMNGMDSSVLCAKITQLRIARHRQKVDEVAEKIKKWDELAEAGQTPTKDRPKDQAPHLKGWIDRAHGVNAYAHSKEFKELADVFERTAPQGADLMDPVRLGTISLKLNSQEPALIRLLQQRLTSVGYTVKEDGRFEKEMMAVVNFFQEHYNLPRQASWGPNETRILDALLVGKERREQPTFAGITSPRR